MSQITHTEIQNQNKKVSGLQAKFDEAVNNKDAQSAVIFLNLWLTESDRLDKLEDLFYK